MKYLFVFGISLILTLITELIVAYAFGFRSAKYLLLVILTNVLTNPAVVYLNMCGSNFAWWNTLCQLPLEVLAIVTEAFIYCRFAKKDGWNIKHPIWLSVCANVISYVLGCFI